MFLYTEDMFAWLTPHFEGMGQGNGIDLSIVDDTKPFQIFH